MRPVKTQITIYTYTNKLNGKVYVGQAISFRKRHNHHLSRVNNNPDCVIDKEIAKYGITNFDINIVDVVDILIADETEAFWITKLNTLTPNGYNIRPGGMTSRGWKHSEKTLLKMSAAQKGENNAMFGKPVSEETRKLLSEALSGENNPMFGRTGESSHWFGKTHTEETKEKMSESMTGIPKSEDHKKKISEARSGENCHWFGQPGYWTGKTLSEETRKNMSEAHKGKTHSEAARQKMSLANKGIPKTEECKRKLSEAKKGRSWKLIDGKRVYDKK